MRLCPGREVPVDNAAPTAAFTMPRNTKSRSPWEAAPRRRDWYESCYAVEATSSMLTFGMPLICTSDTETREHNRAFQPC